MENLFSVPVASVTEAFTNPTVLSYSIPADRAGFEDKTAGNKVVEKVLDPNTRDVWVLSE
jgi:hypothetical protein